MHGNDRKSFAKSNSLKLRDLGLLTEKTNLSFYIRKKFSYFHEISTTIKLETIDSFVRYIAGIADDAKGD